MHDDRELFEMLVLERPRSRLNHGGVEEDGKELKRLGFRFVGPTTAYSLMQAAGLVNDHLDGCEFRDLVEIGANQQRR